MVTGLGMVPANASGAAADRRPRARNFEKCFMAESPLVCKSQAKTGNANTFHLSGSGCPLKVVFALDGFDYKDNFESEQLIKRGFGQKLPKSQATITSLTSSVTKLSVVANIRLGMLP